MTVHFTPAGTGGWLALASGETVLMIGGPTDQVTVDSLWAALTATRGSQSVLDVLTSRGLTATPSFALLEGSKPSLRIIVRGPVTATVTDSDRTHYLDGSGVTTWLEQTLLDVSSVSVAVAPAAGGEGALHLPLDSGASWVSSVQLSFDESADRTGRSGRVDHDGGATVSRPASAAVSTGLDTAAGGLLDKREPEADPEATVTEAPRAPETPIQAESPATLESQPDTPADGYDYLFGATMFRDVAGAAVLEVPLEEELIPAPVGDHDGHTVLTSDIAKLRAERRAKRGENAPTPPAAPAAKIFLAISNGTREPLTQPILVGRSPSVSQVSGGQMPRLVTVGTPDQDISRTHVRFVLEGDTVVVTDLHSRNGTLVALPGKEPQKLRAGEPTSVISGTVVDLGGGITLTVEESAVDEAMGKA